MSGLSENPEVRVAGNDVSCSQDGDHSQEFDSSKLTCRDIKADVVVFETPKSSKGVSINVYNSCIQGSCSCVYMLGGNRTQLMPCRFAALIFSGNPPTEMDWKVFEVILHGVDITEGEIESYECQNYKSILSQGNKEKMDDIIASEIESGAMSLVEDKPHCIHALGAVPKPDGGIRPITDCSRPEGISINDHVNPSDLKFTYKNIDNVTDMLNHGDYMSVIDIKNAYRCVSVNPEQIRYQGLSWEIEGEQRYLIDNRLCFGLRCGPYFFNLISEFIHDKLVQLYNIRLVNYLDDYLTMCNSYEGCLENQRLVIAMLRFVGFQVSWKKVTAPSQKTVYLGIEIDSNLMCISLPEVKVLKMKRMVKEFHGRRSASKKQLERLTGLLAHCATVMKGGRTYCRRLYDLEKIASKLRGRYIRISSEARKDLEWWLGCAPFFNGRSVIKKPVFCFTPTTDASKKGFGAHCGRDWFAGSWYKDWSDDSECGHYISPPSDLPDSELDNINVLELYPVLLVLLVERWGPLCESHKLVLITDNLQVLHMVRTGRSVNSTCMSWLRKLFWLSVQYDLEFESEYITSKDNICADTLSRLMYSDCSDKLEELLLGFDLCCKDILLDRFRESSP